MSQTELQFWCGTPQALAEYQAERQQVAIYKSLPSTSGALLWRDLSEREKSTALQITYLERALAKLEEFDGCRRGSVHLRQEEAIELWRFCKTLISSR